MPPNHQKRIEDAELWDILDWDVVSALAATEPEDPRDDNGAHVMATIARTSQSFCGLLHIALDTGMTQFDGRRPPA
jgi:hypothetical protein